MKNINSKIVFRVKPDELFSAWLNNKKHAEMINASVQIDPKVNGKFEIWDGEIVGKTLKIDVKNLIIEQEWRYSYPDWPEDEPSIIKLEFLNYEVNKTELVFEQTIIPDKYFDDLATGWEEYYWKPMKEYFKSA